MVTKPASVKPETFFTHLPSMIALGIGFLLTVWAYYLQPERSPTFLIVGFFSVIFLAVYLFILGVRNPNVDDLTGFFRKEAFLLLAEQHRKFTMRRKTGFYLMLAEVHPRNDNAIHTAADILRGAFRTADILARMEKGLFALLAIDASQDSRTVIEKRLSHKMADLSDSLSITMGAAFFNPNDTCPTIEELIHTANKKLNDEKEKNKRSGS